MKLKIIKGIEATGALGSYTNKTILVAYLIQIGKNDINFKKTSASELATLIKAMGVTKIELK